LLHHFLVVHYVNALGQVAQVGPDESAVEAVDVAAAGSDGGLQAVDAAAGCLAEIYVVEVERLAKALTESDAGHLGDVELLAEKVGQRDVYAVPLVGGQ